MTKYPRDLIGYGSTPPDPQWPGRARVAVQIVLNYEEGGEANILHGDAHSECYLHEVVGTAPLPGLRNPQIESVYEYGSRAGVWRLLRLFSRKGVPVTVYGVATALARAPEVVAAFKEAGHEIASHGLKWIDYQHMDEASERAHIAEAIALHTQATGERPLGWYTGRVSPNTRRLVAEAGGFLYDADSYADDLPYWEWVTCSGSTGATAPARGVPREPRERSDRPALEGLEQRVPHLIVPYTLDTNDMKFGTAQGFNTGEDFYRYLTDAFDVLYEEGLEAPKMMSVGLHCRLAGRPGRLKGLERFLDHVLSRDRVWLCRRVDIARHWRTVHPAPSL